MAEEKPSTPVRHLHNGILVGPGNASSEQRKISGAVQEAVTIPSGELLSPFGHDMALGAGFMEIDPEILIQRVFNLYSTSFSPSSTVFQVKASGGGGQLSSYSDHHTSENLNLIINVNKFANKESVDVRKRRPVLSVDTGAALQLQRPSLEDGGYRDTISRSSEPNPRDQVHQDGHSNEQAPAAPENTQIPMPTSEKPLYSHREQLMMFRDAFGLPADGAGLFLPQQMYRQHMTSDLTKRYVEEMMLEGPLYFISENPQRCGILLKDALHFQISSLRDRDQAVSLGRGYSVSMRLEWPGYRPWSRQIPTNDFRSPPQPISLATLAKNVARCVKRFMQDRQSLPMEEEANSRWKIGDGPGNIKFEDLMLVSIHHVAQGSWQPHLRLAHPAPKGPCPTETASGSKGVDAKGVNLTVKGAGVKVLEGVVVSSPRCSWGLGRSMFYSRSKLELELGGLGPS